MKKAVKKWLKAFIALWIAFGGALYAIWNLISGFFYLGYAITHKARE